MITIDLYQPPNLDVTIDFPSAWNELTLPELHKVAQSFLAEFTGDQSKAFLLLNLLKGRCGNQVQSVEHRLDAEDCVINGLPAIDFLYNGIELTQQPYKKIMLPDGRWMFGPTDDFNNLTCGEFEDAEIFFNQFKESPTDETLALLAAVLYRPKRVPYLRFIPHANEYKTYDIEKAAPEFKKLKPWELYTIFLWYSGCRAQLPKFFKECFEGGDAEESDVNVFTGCIHAAAGPKNGSRNDIRRTLLKEFFTDLKLEKIAADKMKAEMEKASR